MVGNIFGKRLKELRLERGLSQRALGEVFGVCNETISFWENGSREPNLDDLLRIANYFDVSTDYLLDEKI